LFHSDDYDDCYGRIPTSNLYNNPKYNLVLNTKNLIDYHSEFCSTLDWEISSGPIIGYDTGDDKSDKWSDNIDMRSFTGFTGK
jgi:hypothetical protein